MATYSWQGKYKGLQNEWLGEGAQRLCSLLPNIKIKGQKTIDEDQIKTNKGKLWANIINLNLPQDAVDPNVLYGF